MQRYLESVEDKDAGTSLDHLGKKYLSLESDIESKLFGLHLLAAVWRAFSPGYPYDQILILRGAQGVGKTTTIKTLAGEENYISAAMVPNEKDLLLQLGQCWHYEMEEIDGHIASRHQGQLKALISRHTDNFRVPYGATTEDHPRPCVLWGTTNADELLVDQTGNRRYWIINMTQHVDRDLLLHDRDMIWGTVMKAYRAGHPPTLTSQETRQVASIADASISEDPWLTTLQAATENLPVVFEHELLSKTLKIEINQQKGGRSIEQRRLKDCLKKLGFTKSEKQVNNLSQNRHERRRGVWFAPGIPHTANAKEIHRLLQEAGSYVPQGPKSLEVPF